MKALLSSAAAVGGMTAVSRVLGFVRDMVIARGFGADTTTDAFFVAFKIPNMLRRIFAEGAFAQAFVPVMAAVRAQDADNMSRFISYTALWLTAATALVAAVGIVAAPLLVLVIAPGFDDPSTQALTASLLRIMLPYLVCISLTALLAGVLNSHKRFALPALTPALLNVALIVSALWLAPLFAQPVYALAIGVMAGGLLQLGYQAYWIWHFGLLRAVKPDAVRPVGIWVKKVCRTMVPAVFAASVGQISLFIDTVLASLLADGSVSWLYYADRLLELPLALCGIAMSTVLLTQLSSLWQQGDYRGVGHTVNQAMRLLLVAVAPATVALIVVALPIIETLFGYGRFSDTDARMVARALMMFAAGLPAFVLVKLLLPIYFAKHDTRRPALIAVVALCINVVLNLILMRYLAHAGLALATSLSAYAQAALLWRGAYRDGLRIEWHALWHSAWRVTVAMTMAGLAATLLWQPAVFWLSADAVSRVSQLALLIAVVVVVYAAVLSLLRIRRVL